MTKNQTKELLELTLHPVRMRILMLLAGSQGLTPQQMAEQMADIPQATLYRHINRLAQGGLLAVAAERQVRGTLEKAYILNQSAPDGSGEELFRTLSKEDHMRYFTAFTMTLLDDFSRYLHHDPDRTPDLARDGVGYQKVPLNLSDEELAAFATAFNQAVMPFFNLPPAPGRKKRLFSTIMLPSTETTPADTNDNNPKD